MSNNAMPDDSEEKPLDPAVERVRRKMLRLMVISIGIMFVGLMAVLFAIVYKVSARGENPATAGDVPAHRGGEPFETVVPLPQDSRIMSQSLAGDRLVLLIEAADGRQSLVVFDLAEGRVIGRIAIGVQ